MLSAFSCLAAVALAGYEAPAADLVLSGGKIWTADSRQPEAEAVAIWQGKILAVGANEQIAAHIGPSTRVIPLQGRRVVPGFGDSHVHLLSGGLQLRSVDLKDARDEAEFGARLREFDRKLPPGRWLLGGNWDHDRTLTGKLPTAALLDRYVPDRPFAQQRISVTEALQAYTLGSAYAVRREHELGSLTPGKLADLVVLSRNILDEAEGDHIAETRVLITIVGGREVFDATE